jgi:hypothetical protein
MKMEPVTDIVKLLRLQAFFINVDGKKISFPVLITANIKATDAEDNLSGRNLLLRVVDIAEIWNIFL